MTRLWLGAAYLAISTLSSTAAQAQDTPFGEGWQLDSEASSLQFQSIKNQSKIETSSFASITGAIAPDGRAAVKILLDSVDTKVDLRNVRMRFLFFETFQYPEANISTQIEPSMVADLASLRRKTVSLPFTLDLHGVTKALESELSLTLISDDLIAVSTAEPININVADFNLTEGLKKLEEAANVSVVPSTSVNFDFIFRASKSDTTDLQLAVTEPVAEPASAALEAEGDFSLEACVGRFEILSRSGNIYFQPGSARLDKASTPLLDTVADIVSRCPGLDIQVAGHTDSVGPDQANQRLSERRAASVVSFLTSRGIEANRMQSLGYGEDRPVADNSTKEGRSRNRRIEFSVAGS